MASLHQQLAAGRWYKLSLFEQLANIGSEVERALNWYAKGDNQAGEAAFYRALDLLDLTLGDRRLKGRYKEIARLRELLCDYFTNQRQYHSDAKSIQSYFVPFFYAVSRGR